MGSTFQCQVSACILVRRCRACNQRYIVPHMASGGALHQWQGCGTSQYRLMNYEIYFENSLF